MFSKRFGIITWDGPRDKSSSTSKSVKTALCRRDGRPPGTANLFDRLPNEVLQLIFSELVDCPVVFQEGFDATARSPGCLRLVSHRFKANMDCLLLRAAQKSVHIRHIGGLPTTSLARMKDMYATYRTDLWMRLSPVLRSGRVIKMLISFQP